MDIISCKTEFKTGVGEDEGVYEGYFSIFGNEDSGGDIALNGMFAKTLKESGHRVKVLYAHDWGKVIGPTPEVLQEDNVGLFAKGRLTLGSFWGREVWELMKDGAIDEASFGYRTIKADYDKEGRRLLKEVQLYEVSPVPLGMNMLTNLRTVKSLFDVANSIELPDPTVKFGLDDESKDVDVNTIRQRLNGDAKALRESAAVFFGDDPSKEENYDFLHHLPNGKIHLGALIDASERLMNGEYILTPIDLHRVKRHIATHLEEAGLPVPWEAGQVDRKEYILRTAELMASQVDVLRTLDTKGRARIVSIIETLSEELAEAAKPELARLALEARFKELQTSLQGETK